MATIARFAFFLLFLHHGGHVFGQVTTSVTTLAASLCDVPSCTVTPTSVRDITIHPSPTTILVPGRALPLAFSFDSIVLSSFQPSPTVLPNNGRGVLTLGTITITNLPSASATQSYTVDGQDSITLTAAVTVAVEARAQLFIAEENSLGSLCNAPGFSGPRRLLKSRSRVIGRQPHEQVKHKKLTKRAANFQLIGDTEEEFAIAAAKDAKTVIDTFLQYFRNIDSPSPATLRTIGLDRWLPMVLPGVGTDLTLTFTRIKATAVALQQFLDPMGGTGPPFGFFVTSIDIPAEAANTQEGQSWINLKNDECAGNGVAATRTDRLPVQDCGISGYIIICPEASKRLNEQVLISDFGTPRGQPGPDLKPELCTDTTRNLINNREWELDAWWGARGATMYHELLHMPNVCARAGWPMVPSQGETVQSRANWNIPDGQPEVYTHTAQGGKGVYAPNRILPPMLPAEQQIWNARNWEFTFTEFYIRRLCQFTTDGSDWPDLGNGK